jgi:putative cell wall-binding protein
VASAATRAALLFTLPFSQGGRMSSGNSPSLRRAGIGALAALVCAGLVALGAPAAQADFGDTGGTVAAVDANASAPGTQVPEVQAGGLGAQPVADVKLTIPNTFAKGDVITLQLFDRSATGVTPTTMADGGADKLVLSGAPTVKGVDPKGNDSTAFTATTAASAAANGQGNDLVVLTAGAASSADTGDFTLTVSGLKVLAGANVAPGAIRLVPFATNGCDIPLPLLCFLSPATASPVFAGNETGKTINTYTVVGFVTPAKITAGDPSGIVSDGTAQLVGDVTIAEVSPIGLGEGPYTVTVSGATVRNDTAGVGTNHVIVTLLDKDGKTVVTNVQATVTPTSITFPFTKAAADLPGRVSVVLHGILLSSTTNSQVGYTLTGGSLTGSLADPGTAPDDKFGSKPDAAEAAIVPPKVTTLAGTAVGTGNRISGADRYATAAQVALTNDARNHNGATVILASGEAFPDALSAAFLSQRLGGASVLLTRPNALPTATESALRQLGTTRVVVVGGGGAIGARPFSDVQAIVDANAGGPGKGQVTRLFGADRYATNQAVNNAASNLGTTPIGTTTITFGQAKKRTALLATGENYADALASAPATAGADNPIPLVLTTSGALSPSARSQLQGLGIEQVVVVGGDGAVSPAVVSELGTLGVAVKRISGATRYETALAVADFERAAVSPASAAASGGLGFTGGEVFLATGQAYADALTGGPLAANQGSPVVLTTSATLFPAVGSWLTAHKSGLSAVTALGGSAAVSNAALQAAQAALL